VPLRFSRRIIALAACLFIFYAVVPDEIYGKTATSDSVEKTAQDELEEDENSDLNLKYFLGHDLPCFGLASRHFTTWDNSLKSPYKEEIPTPPPLKA